jgi:DNA repair protein RecN (Recombination protein N)
MLEDLTIKDFALIDSVTIEFSKGFTVLSGETGAGKSILIGALSFLLGGKSDVDLIRAGTHEADVSGTFLLDGAAGIISPAILLGTSGDAEPQSAADWLMQNSIEPENNRVLLRRYIRDNGKTAAWIQDKPVTRVDLAAFSEFLVDIHGQHEHQSLMHVSEHRKFLDLYAGSTAESVSFTALYAQLVEKRKLLTQFVSSDNDRKQKIDMYSFAVKEINDAKLKPDEDINLEEEENKLSSYEKLYASVDSINTTLSGDETSSVLPLLKKIRHDSTQALGMDKKLTELDTRIESSFYELSDIAEEFSSYAQKLVFDPARLAEVQDRLSLIYNLKKKYASSPSAPLSEVVLYGQEAQLNLDRLGGGTADKAALEKESAELEKKVYTAAKILSEKRKAAAGKMSAAVEQILTKLGMAGTRFAVKIADKPGTEIEQKCGPYGMDNIEFLICANPGAPLLPLAQIASGGELSRVMLALKTVFSQTDPIPTLVFDEIDTGIGGEVAVSVGSHMKNLAKSRQILCITHLASIAVYADKQIKIEKNVFDGKTSSHVHPVNGQERVAEIARMLSGDIESTESLEHAQSMLQKYSGGV